ncbi:hypothetical protein ABK040_010703 [Willaertia magna]
MAQHYSIGKRIATVDICSILLSLCFGIWSIILFSQLHNLELPNFTVKGDFICENKSVIKYLMILSILDFILCLLSLSMTIFGIIESCINDNTERSNCCFSNCFCAFIGGSIYITIIIIFSILTHFSMSKGCYELEYINIYNRLLPYIITRWIFVGMSLFTITCLLSIVCCGVMCCSDSDHANNNNSGGGRLFANVTYSKLKEDYNNEGNDNNNLNSNEHEEEEEEIHKNISNRAMEEEENNNTNEILL